MKIISLSPCLMQENTREANSTALNQLYETFKFDEYVVYDQCFEETDYHPGFKYIGHAKQKMGWVTPRNKLLEYFYNSDADYAFWIDANSTVTKTCWNDLATVIEAVRSGEACNCDAIFSTLGIWVSQDRIVAKSADDYFDNVHLIPAKENKSYNWMHGLFIKNFKKYYNQEFTIDDRCNMLEGTPEDVFFARLLRKFVSCYVAPTITISKPSNKSSTWAHQLKNYDYPPVLFDKVDDYILQHAERNRYKSCNMHSIPRDISIPRVEFMKSSIKAYQPRKKKINIEPIRTALF